MHLKFFWIPVIDNAEEEHEVNSFLASHRIGAVEKHFCAGGAEPSGWAICVTWLQSDSSDRLGPAKPGKVDYREALDAESFRIFSALRSWRKNAAAEAGVPLYTIATNEQLAEISKKRITTATGLNSVAGFGSSRKAKYQESLLEVCREAIQSPQTNSDRTQ